MKLMMWIEWPFAGCDTEYEWIDIDVDGLSRDAIERAKSEAFQEFIFNKVGGGYVAEGELGYDEEGQQ